MSVDLNCGLRAKELRKLRWWRIDLVHKKQLTVGKSKTGAGTGRVIPLNDTVMVALEAHAAFPESTVDANVYVIIEPCSTFGNTSIPLDEAPSRSGCAHSTFMPRRK